MGLVGESGCGKSTTAYALMKLLLKNGNISSGQVIVSGLDLISASEEELRASRWRDMSIIFQNAMTALNPVQKIGNQIVSALLHHEKVSRAEAIERAEYIFEKVGISPQRLMQYPHEFSHVGERTSLEAIEESSQPCIFSHSNARNATPTTKRNLTDEMIKAVSAKGGLIGLSSHAFLCHHTEGIQPTLEDYMDHFVYVTNLVGTDHIGIGTDIYEY